MREPTKAVTLNIDVNPDGVHLTIPGLENDLAKLIGAGKSFEVTEIKYRSVDSSDVHIRSTQALQFTPREIIEEDIPIDPPIENTPPETP